MVPLFLGLYGLYFALVGVQNNGDLLVEMAKEDIPDFLPWVLAIALLALLSDFKTTRNLVLPFAGLLALNFVLRNYETIEAEFIRLYQLSKMEGE